MTDEVNLDNTNYINIIEMKACMYILLCSNGKYYTGSTRDLETRIEQHISGEGANFTRKHLPVKLVYYEEFDRIDDAFYREKQIQGWSHKKKEALINGDINRLHELAKSRLDSARRPAKPACLGLPRLRSATDQAAH